MFSLPIARKTTMSTTNLIATYSLYEGVRRWSRRLAPNPYPIICGIWAVWSIFNASFCVFQLVCRKDADTVLTCDLRSWGIVVEKTNILYIFGSCMLHALLTFIVGLFVPYSATTYCALCIVFASS